MSRLEIRCNFPMLPGHALRWQRGGVGVGVRVGVTAISSSHDAPLPAQWHTLWDVASCGWDRSIVSCQIYFSTGCWWKSADVEIWKRSGLIVKSQQEPHTHRWMEMCVFFLAGGHLKLKQICSCLKMPFFYETEICLSIPIPIPHSFIFIPVIPCIYKILIVIKHNTLKRRL